jgi:hypothetical protein
MDLHEIIFPRQRAMGNHAGMLALMHKCNCGYVHRECHKYGEGGEGQERAIIYLLRYEGLTNLLDYIRSLENLIPDLHEEARKVNIAWDKMTLIMNQGYDG